MRLRRAAAVRKFADAAKRVAHRSRTLKACLIGACSQESQKELEVAPIVATQVGELDSYLKAPIDRGAPNDSAADLDRLGNLVLGEYQRKLGNHALAEGNRAIDLRADAAKGDVLGAADDIGGPDDQVDLDRQSKAGMCAVDHEQTVSR